MDVKYIIGIDTYDKNSYAYCVSRKIGDVIEVIICKTLRDEDNFKKEVNNLSKYFNAPIFGEDGEIKKI